MGIRNWVILFPIGTLLIAALGRDPVGATHTKRHPVVRRVAPTQEVQEAPPIAPEPVEPILFLPHAEEACQDEPTDLAPDQYDEAQTKEDDAEMLKEIVLSNELVEVRYEAFRTLEYQGRSGWIPTARREQLFRDYELQEYR